MATENKYQKSIDMLNLAIASENTAIMQYMYFHIVCEDQGYRPLAKYFKKAAIDEMIHCERLAARVLYLEGDFKMVMEIGVENINVPKDMLDYARKLEVKAIDDYNKYYTEAARLGDSGTQTLFRELITQEESHMDQFRLEMENAERFGKEYLTLQVIDNLKHLE